MRTRKLLFVAVLASLLAMPAVTALAQPSGNAPDKRALASGSNKLRSFGSTGSQEIKETPKDPMVPLYALVLCLLIGGGCLPVAMKLMKENNKRLADEATFGRNPDGVGEPVSKRAGPRGGGTSDKLARVGDAGEESPSMPRLSPEEVHERVWYKLQEVQKFLSAEGVAKLAKLDLEQTREELQMLAKDGYLEVGRDKSGRPIYRILEDDSREA